ncbi:6-phospho-3-hexuloisomerase [Nocardioides panaciterrulae]|uniref:6-phospho-3-hexuloisomerase n=1 Tax=Nocardioides panaciterrulae TaxID=661492 RepID=A0A7Y9JD63_9ACTN|nr:6-phospho-3-hexuloisomerase [Nocardioides panaciterrulae]NYD42969.1 6-phospho-3-hexuloisomerase [Nocardioides panaciterrulae]
MTTDNLSTVLLEIEGVAHKTDRGGIDALVDRLLDAPHVFVTGEGRSGLMGKAFAMRLMHLGLSVYAIGETITPAVREGDLVVAISGSGKTGGTVRAAQSARSAGAGVHAVTTDPHSPLGEAADGALVLPAATKYRRADEAPTIQPLSSLFDQMSHIVLDVVCLEVARRRDVDNDLAGTRHSNTE